MAQYEVKVRLIVNAEDVPDEDDFILYISDDAESSVEIEAEWWEVDEYAEDSE